MSISTIDQLYTWAYPTFTTTAHEHILNWPALDITSQPLHMSISTTAHEHNPLLTTTAHEHFHHWPLLNMNICTINHHPTKVYPSLINPANKHIHYWPPVHMTISIICLNSPQHKVTNNYHCHNYTTSIFSINNNIILTYPQIAPTGHGHQYH